MMTDFVEWKPEFDGQKPPFWQDGMDWGFSSVAPTARTKGAPSWSRFNSYVVPREAVHGLVTIAAQLRQYPAEELAKHGITLAPEPDWATELLVDILDLLRFNDTAALCRKGALKTKAALELIRSRATPKNTGT